MIIILLSLYHQNVSFRGSRRGAARVTIGWSADQPCSLLLEWRPGGYRWMAYGKSEHKKMDITGGLGVQPP